MRVTFDFNVRGHDIEALKDSLDGILTKVGNGSRKALIQCLEDIQDESLRQVPIDTATLANSSYYAVDGDYKTGWTGRIGYGEPNYRNPNSGLPVKAYMMRVHEDLTIPHKIGKAKFLEDPIREYAAVKFPRTVFTVLRETDYGTVLHREARAKFNSQSFGKRMRQTSNMVNFEARMRKKFGSTNAKKEQAYEQARRDEDW